MCPWPRIRRRSAAEAARESKLVWLKNQYREALAKARAEGKLVFVNFTGYACTNCHWMKANMFPRPEIAGALGNYVLVELYTDGSDEASQLNQQLEESKFKTIAIPFYAILDPDENVIASFGQQTRDAKEFLAFVEKGAQPRPAAAPVVAATARRMARSPACRSPRSMAALSMPARSRAKWWW